MNSAITMRRGSGSYACLNRAPSKRAIDDELLTGRIRAIHVRFHATYGIVAFALTTRPRREDQPYARSAADAPDGHPRRQLP